MFGIEFGPPAGLQPPDSFIMAEVFFLKVNGDGI
jgi:hypothetical protein